LYLFTSAKGKFFFSYFLAEAAEAAEAAQEQPEPTGFFEGRNLYLIGGVALAAIAGIYFLTKKK